MVGLSREVGDRAVCEHRQTLSSWCMSTPAVEDSARTLGLESVDRLTLPLAQVSLAESGGRLNPKCTARRLQSKLSRASGTLEVRTQHMLQRRHVGDLLSGCTCLFLTERGEGDILVPGEDTTAVGLALSVTQEDPETH